MTTTAALTWTRTQPGTYEAIGRGGAYAIQRIGRATWVLSSAGTPDSYHPSLTVARECADEADVTTPS
jgi:hypothetical protein